MCLPQSCCCCCSLNTGSFVLGVFGTIISTICMMVLAFTHFLISVDRHTDSEWQNSYGYASLMYLLLSFILSVIIYVVLLAGAHLKKPLLLKLWLIGEMLNSIGRTVIVIINGIIICIIHGDFGFGIYISLIGLVHQGVVIYWWLCMASHYKNLCEEANNPPCGVVYIAQAPVQQAPSSGQIV